MKSRNESKRPAFRHAVDAKWEEWVTKSGFLTIEDAYQALGLTRGSFYRQCVKPPSHTIRLAMAALYHKIKPF